MKYGLVLFLAAASCFASEAQLKLPVRMVGNTEYYYRKVKKKETLYGISKELGISTDDIIKYNPSVKSGLKKDQWLYFPVADFNRNKTEVKNTKKKVVHYVEPGETLYGISRIYGISIDEIKAANPSIAGGLKSGNTIVIPESKTGTGEPTPYTIKKGETLYRVSVNHHVSIESLLEANPGISPDNFKAGDVIMIPPAEKAEIEKNNRPETVFIAEKVDKGDTFESVAKKYDTSVKEIKDANPDRNKLKKGSFVYVPVTHERDSITDEEIAATYQTVHEVEEITRINMSVIFPFESKKETPSQKAELYTDFYKGILLAANEYADDSIEISLNAFDLSDISFPEIMTYHSDEIKNSDMIFVAGENGDIREASSIGKEYGVNIIDAFDVNSTGSYDNEHFFQINTPSSYMYSAVNSMIEDKFGDRRMVFISDGETEAKPLIGHLKKTNLTKQTIDINELEDTEMLRTIVPSSKKILFVPELSSTTMLNRIKRAFKKLATDCPEYEYSLLGYPEWLNYQASEPFFHQNDTYIYSRYTTAGADSSAAEINKEYEYWYGKRPVSSMPQMNIFGYDLARYFIDTIRENGNDFNSNGNAKEGVQTCIDLKRVSNWGGFVNTSVFLIHFSENNSTERYVIK